jgi:SAM-dependent methyltransferase
MRLVVINFLIDTILNKPWTEPIYEFGSCRDHGQFELANLRPYFPGKSYVGCDIHKGIGVDRVENLNCLTLEDKVAGTVLCFETLEHVENPFMAIKEMHRILKPGGLIIISSVFNFPIHNHPKDYWRFTPECFRFLMAPWFEEIEIGYDGNKEHPFGVFGRGRKVNDLAGSTTQEVTNA